jgi:hypothetical protein
VLTLPGSLSPTARKSCQIRMEVDSRVKVRGTHLGKMAFRVMPEEVEVGVLPALLERHLCPGPQVLHPWSSKDHTQEFKVGNCNRGCRLIWTGPLRNQHCGSFSHVGISGQHQLFTKPQLPCAQGPRHSSSHLTLSSLLRYPLTGWKEL